MGRVGVVLLVLLVIAAVRRWVHIIRGNAAQRLQRERRLRDSERTFRTIFDRAIDAQLLVDDGHVVTANAMAADLFGVSTPEALQHRLLDDLLSLPPGADIRTTSSHEFTVHCGETDVPVQCTVTDVPLDGRVLTHLVIRDLTMARQAKAEKAWFEAQIREAQKLEALGTLAAGVAHDFNNLLGVIRGNAELAKSALRKGRSNEEHLGAILDASDRARDVVRQLLTFSRRSTPTREYVNLSRLVLDLQPLLRRMIPRTVRLVIEGAEQAQLMMGDPTQLQQLLLNLVSNAEYAMRDKTDGVLTITLSSRHMPDSASEPHGAVVVLQVRDTGDGMSVDVRNRMFEPFFTTKPTGEGTGLGMAVLHGIVVSHLGRADVTSEIGQGTTFELRFPRNPWPTSRCRPPRTGAPWTTMRPTCSFRVRTPARVWWSWTTSRGWLAWWSARCGTMDTWYTCSRSRRPRWHSFNSSRRRWTCYSPIRPRPAWRATGWPRRCIRCGRTCRC